MLHSRLPPPGPEGPAVLFPPGWRYYKCNHCSGIAKVDNRCINWPIPCPQCQQQDWTGLAEPPPELNQTGRTGA